MVETDSLRQNLLERLEIQKSCSDNKEKQLAAIELCRRDILYFFKWFAWTYDPRITPSELPFIPYEPYQTNYIKEVNTEIEAGVSSLTEKSRDMGVTWAVLGIFVYRWLFLDETFLIGSRKQELVDTIGDIDSLFERIRFMLSRLPKWMLLACGYDEKNSGFMKLYKDNGASIVGESTNPDFSRQGRYKAILLDEFAFVEGAEAVWRSCGDSSPCKLVVSTPNGKANFFARLRFSGKIKVHTLHWKAHPKKDDAWYRAEVSKRSEYDLAQEVDINYNVSAGTPFYGGFREHLHTGIFEPILGRTLMLGWDFGYIHPACVITQLDYLDRWIILKEIMGSKITIDLFADMVIRILNEEYANCPVIHFGDPACVQVNDKSEFTSWQILSKKNIDIIYRASEYRQRKEIIEHRLHTLHDGKPAMMVDKSCRIIIEGFLGGYHYPILHDNQQFLRKFEFPFKDGYYEHPMNAMEYIAVNAFSPVKQAGRSAQYANQYATVDNV